MRDAVHHEKLRVLSTVGDRWFIKYLRVIGSNGVIVPAMVTFAVIFGETLKPLIHKGS